MELYELVSQLIALAQWRAQAQAHYTCTYNCLSVTVGLSGSQAEPDRQWIRVCRVDSQADLRDCQWPSLELKAASLQLLIGQLELQDMCQWWAPVHKFKFIVTSNLKFSTLNLKLEVVVAVSGSRLAATATSPSPWAESRSSPFSWTPVPSTLAMMRPKEVRRLVPDAPNQRHPAAQVPWYRLTYHEICDITWLWHQKLLISGVMSWPKSWVRS